MKKINLDYSKVFNFINQDELNQMKVLKILTIQSGKNCPINIPTMIAIINLGTKPNFLAAITFPPLKKYKYFIFI